MLTILLIYTISRFLDRKEKPELVFGIDRSIDEEKLSLEKSFDVLIHPKYVNGFNMFGDRLLDDLSLNESAFGVAIIRLKEPLKMDDNTNSVCIPSASVKVSTNQYVMNGRWSLYDSMTISMRVTIDNPLLDSITDPQMRQTFQRMTFADKSIVEAPYNMYLCDVINDNILHNSYQYKLLSRLQFDIGSPIYQYNRRRAVIVGIRIADIPEVGYWECKDFNDLVGINIRVSQVLDWITNVTQSN